VREKSTTEKFAVALGTTGWDDTICVEEVTLVTKSFVTLIFAIRDVFGFRSRERLLSIVAQLR